MGKAARVGFVGCPSELGFEAVRKRFERIEWVDLDNFHEQSTRHSAEVLPANKPMLAIFHNSGLKVSTEYDGDAYNIWFDLQETQDDG